MCHSDGVIGTNTLALLIFSGKQRCVFRSDLLRVRGGGSGAYSSRASIRVGVTSVVAVSVSVRNPAATQRSGSPLEVPSSTCQHCSTKAY